MMVRREEAAQALDAGQLVERAAEGDGWAWERLVEQYSRLIWAVTRDFKLVESDAADVAQVTWLRLLEHIRQIEHPEHVGSWLATTARHECLRNLTARKKVVLASDDSGLEQVATPEPDIDERLLAAERAQDVRDALSCLPRRWQQLLQLLMTDPPASYAEISDQLGLPIGSIGPTRARCLARLRQHLQAAETGATSQPATTAARTDRQQAHTRPVPLGAPLGTLSEVPWNFGGGGQVARAQRLSGDGRAPADAAPAACRSTACGNRS